MRCVICGKEIKEAPPSYALMEILKANYPLCKRCAELLIRERFERFINPFTRKEVAPCIRDGSVQNAEK